MTLIITSLMLSLIMIMVTKVPLAYAMNRLPGGYDNRYPREQFGQLEDFGRRALAAHQNSLEAFPMFAAGLSIALWSNANTETIQNLCITFIVARILYTLSYWFNVHVLRSVFWSVGFGVCLWLMALALPAS